MTHMRKYTRLLAVVVQLLLFTTPLHADFNPTNPPEPNITNSLNVGVTPTEAGRVSGGGKYKQGTSVYISTSAYTNYKFLYWTINGYPYEQTKTSFYYTMGDSAVTFIAHYEYVEPTPEPFDPTNPPEPQIKQHLSVELDIEEGGYTRGTGNYKSGERVYVQAVLETNYELQYWTINGYPYSETNKSFYYVVGDTNAHFVAHIAEKHLLTLKTQPRAAGVSTMKMNGSQFSDMLVAPGKVIDFNTTKNEDYIFRYWTINGFTHTTETAFRYTMGDTTASVVAVYDYVGTGDTTVFNPGNPPEPELRENVTVVVLSADESKGTVSGGGTYLFGTLDTITATPLDGFTFRRWHDGNTETPRVIRAERDTVYIAYFGNDTVVWNDTICYGETLSVGDSLLAESGHYEFYTTRADGYLTWNIVDLTVWHQMSSTLDATIYAGESFIYEGVEYTQPGTYPLTLQNAFGCDSLVTLTLNVLPQVEDHEEHITICYGESYTWSVNGATYHNSVVVSDTLADSNGRDSVITLHLTMLPEVPITIISDTICYGDTYTWATNGQTYSTSTTVYDTLSNSYACDSIVVLQLHVRPQVPLTEETVVVKFGETYTWHGTTYDASGDYSLTIPDSHGCDSTLVLHLTVLPETPVTEFNSFICAGDSLTWEGLTFTTSGDYSVTVQDANGYDSILVMHLTVLEPTFTTISDTICYGESYTWAENGKTYTKSATVSVQYSSIYGCDSTITLHLTVLPANTETVVTEQFCFYDTFTWPLNGKSYNTSATDTVTLLDRHGCDSVVILHLTQLPHHETIIQDTICYGDTYLWAENGQSYSSSVVDSIVLPDSNGCDSVIFLHLTMLPEIPQTIYQDTICQGDKYTWYLTGQTYTTNTDTSVVLTNINGCDSVVRLMLYVRPIQETITNMTICYGESFEWEGNIYTTTTKRSLKYQDIYGCDSIVTLNLTVIPQIPMTTLYETICYGDTYVFAGQICDSTATYTATLASIDGCDSTVTLHLTVLPEVPITQENATICYGETYTWHAATYNTSGDYTTTLLDANGCDSLIMLHLTVLPEVPITQEYATICNGYTYTWQGATYNTSGDYTTTLLDANGCDSLITLHLTVLPEVPTTHLYDTICNGYTYTWRGTTYNASGDYTTTLLDANGCDSLITLHLHVLQDIQPTKQHVSICYGETYVWNGAVYDQSGVYSTTLTSVHGCDSTVMLILTVLPQNPITEETVSIAFGTSYNWHGESYSVAGDYTTTLTDSHGCDSIVILHLQTVNTSLSVSTSEQCADDPFLEFYIDDYTTFRNIAFQWDEAAHTQQLHDTIVHVTSPYISIPNTARAGVYDVQVSAVFNGQHFGAQSLTVTLLYPSSVLDQHWDDFIGVLTHDYNGGYDFVSFQWYKDSEPLPGETKSYLSSALEFGASYSAMLEDANGVKLMTCPIIATPQTEISLYPSMLTPRQTIHIHTSQYATIQFFTLTGDLLYSTQQEPGEILLQAPERTGLYIVQIMYHDNTNRVLTRKITVR